MVDRRIGNVVVALTGCTGGLKKENAPSGPKSTL